MQNLESPGALEMGRGGAEGARLGLLCGFGFLYRRLDGDCEKLRTSIHRCLISSQPGSRRRGEAQTENSRDVDDVHIQHGADAEAEQAHNLECLSGVIEVTEDHIQPSAITYSRHRSRRGRTGVDNEHEGGILEHAQDLQQHI